MDYKNPQAACDLTLIASGQTLDLLGDVLNVQAGDVQQAQAAALLVGPGAEIYLVARPFALEKRNLDAVDLAHERNIALTPEGVPAPRQKA